MYLLNAETTIQWELLATATPPSVSDLDLIIIDPLGNSTYVDSPILPDDYVAPTATQAGQAVYRITPNLEGLWRIRLVTGTANNYNILSKVEMFVFDNTTVTSPYSDEIGRPVPYDINFFLQGHLVSNEIYGTFVASRSIAIANNAPGSKAIAADSPEFYDVTLLIMHNGVQIGTIEFPIGQTEGAITIVATPISVGDTIQVVTQNGIFDARIRDIAINLVGCCTVVPCTVF